MFAQVFGPEILGPVLAVEPNRSMRSIAQKVMAARQPPFGPSTGSPGGSELVPAQQPVQVPGVSWVDKLPYYGPNPPLHLTRVNDLVMASYVLNEIPDPEEKRKASVMHTSR